MSEQPSMKLVDAELQAEFDQADSSDDQPWYRSRFLIEKYGGGSEYSFPDEIGVGIETIEQLLRISSISEEARRGIMAQVGEAVEYCEFHFDPLDIYETTDGQSKERALQLTMNALTRIQAGVLLEMSEAELTEAFQSSSESGVDYCDADTPFPESEAELAAIVAVLRQIADVYEVEMSRLPKRSAAHILARLKWGKAQVGICRANGDNMQAAYEKGVRNCEKLLGSAEFAR